MYLHSDLGIRVRNVATSNNRVHTCTRLVGSCPAPEELFKRSSGQAKLVQNSPFLHAVTNFAKLGSPGVSEPGFPRVPHISSYLAPTLDPLDARALHSQHGSRGMHFVHQTQTREAITSHHNWELETYTSRCCELRSKGASGIWLSAKTPPIPGFSVGFLGLGGLLRLTLQNQTAISFWQAGP